jgi:glutaminyl-peptide cyclotransferase
MTKGFVGRRGLVLFAAGGLAMVAIACASRSARTGTTGSVAGLPPFDSGAAWNALEAQMAFGPRPVGTPAHEKLKDYLNTELRKTTSDVQLQQWTDPTIHLPLTNLIARFPGKGTAPAVGGRQGPQSGAPGAVFLAAHWDTRPTADYDPDPANRSKPIPGADDGASETAVLLELARVLKQNPPPVTVWLIFFDGEDYGPGVDRMFIGSRYFAKNQPPGTPQKGVLLDMIGAADLTVPKEQTSLQRAPAVVTEVWAAARRAGHAAEFPDQTGDNIYDDHIPLLNAGIACIDVIDFTYAPWHTLADTADKCSARALGVVGDTMIAWIYGQK